MTSLLQSQYPCRDIRASFSEYLDGAVSGETMRDIASHLESCAACTHEFTEWRAMQESLAVLRRPKVPEHLALKLRLAISREQSRQSSSFFDSVGLHWDNAVRPLLVQVSAGFAMAVALLGTVGLLLGTVAVPPAVMANDEPLGAMTPPHYRYSAERARPIVTSQDATIVVEAEINSRGQVFDYTIISGPQDAASQTQVRNQLLSSIFEPAHVFGEPVRGRVLVTYSGVSVHG